MFPKLALLGNAIDSCVGGVNGGCCVFGFGFWLTPMSSDGWSRSSDSDVADSVRLCALMKERMTREIKV